MGLLDGIFGNDETTASAASTPGGILPGLSLALPGISISILPTSDSFSSLPPTSTSASSSSSSVSSVSSLSTSSSSSSSTPTTTSSSSSSSDLNTSSAGQQTVSHTVIVTASQSAEPDAHPSSFLQNKALAGSVFGIVGLIVLIAVFSVVTFALRRRSRNRLLNEAVSFDPSTLPAASDHYDQSEKGRASFGSSANGHGGAYGTYGSPPAPPQDYYTQPAMQSADYQGFYAPQQAYYPYVAPNPQISEEPRVAPSHNKPRVPVPTSADEAAPAEPAAEQEEASRILKVTNA